MVGREATTFAAQLIDLKTINFRRFVDAAPMALPHGC
jgi:hypothetical protein